MIFRPMYNGGCESQSIKKIWPIYDEIMMKIIHDEIYDETYDETYMYDVLAVRTVSKCLARIKGCWDPEFESSVEEIMDY